MLLPAVQKVREAANRATCENHLKQIGIALHAYHDVYGYFPPGGSELSGASAAPTNRRDLWSWAYHILPFVEQEIVWKHTNHNTIAQTPIKIYYCPSRRAAALYNGSARLDYAGNAGTDSQGRNGVFVETGKGLCNIALITDGTSNTVMAGEKQLNAANFGHTTDDNEPYNRPGWNGDFDVFRLGSVTPAKDTRVAGGTAASNRFGSAHIGGFNAVFCDGSVRHVRFSVSAATWKAACVRNDNLTYDQNGF
jgi:prepilin-type processing-associated H-X9-DG protein